ncbi:D-Ala-D-Ala carboxypeptidase family metallohydrolase [Qipengyuania sp.]|uniref:D-Ala-D-Ala carboxypeptidase family metallohydrolase n=1 Tax=Qipengyuania sp. TaxID=2004515 RepID=UPI0035C83D61
MQLSPHFTLEEMVVSQTAARRGIDNMPPAPAVGALKTLCVEVLEPVRTHFGRPVVVSSGYRGPELNRAIGGASSSQHCKGEAADITVPGIHVLDVAQWIQRNLRYDQLIYEFGRWVHVSYRHGRLRQHDLTARIAKGRTQYVAGLRA